MIETITYQINRQEFEAAIDSKLQELISQSEFNRFSGKLVTVNTVAEVHGVHRDTVVRHVKAGNIPYIKEGEKTYFDMRDVLKLDFSQMRKH